MVLKPSNGTTPRLDIKYLSPARTIGWVEQRNDHTGATSVYACWNMQRKQTAVNSQGATNVVSVWPHKRDLVQHKYKCPSDGNMFNRDTSCTVEYWTDYNMFNIKYFFFIKWKQTKVKFSSLFNLVSRPGLLVHWPQWIDPWRVEKHRFW